jgi:hypothetical protein
MPMKPPKFTFRLSILLTPGQRERAEALATERGQSVAELFRELLDRELDRSEGKGLRAKPREKKRTP